jgi:hypothetical protein
VDVRLEATAPDGRPVPLRGVSTTRSGASATFEIPVLPSREYVLVASAGLRYTGRTRVSVANEDVDGVAISIRPPADVQGQILFDPPPPPGALGQVSLHFFYKGLMGSMEVESRVSPDGTFSVPGLGARDFVIEPVGLPERYYIESASFGGLDPFRNLFNPAAAPGSLLLIRAASSPGRITGRVLDARGRPFESAEVTLVPEGNQAGRHDLYRSVLTGEDGAFALETIRPGAYRVFAWRRISARGGSSRSGRTGSSTSRSI